MCGAFITRHFHHYRFNNRQKEGLCSGLKRGCVLISLMLLQKCWNSLEAGFDKRLKFHISLLLVSSLCVISQPIEPRALVCPASRVAHSEWCSSAPRLISGLFQTLWMWNIGGVGRGASPLRALWAQGGKFPNERQECYCELSPELWCLENGGLSVGSSFHRPLTLLLRSGGPLAEWIYMPPFKNVNNCFFPPLYNNLIIHKVI